ncbi:MAG: EmrB/QacA family drug resistance transporter, partial [Tomitella sp.]|nr:EmrB/QacA family drug resistance transporter [Tomitella sp.]
LMGFTDHTTPIWHLSIYMILMGLGQGMLMQNLVLVVQNTVDIRDIGTASGVVSFFRSLGGAVGVTALGAVLTHLVGNNVKDGMSKLGVPADQLTGSSGQTDLDIGGLPGPVQAVFHAAYADAFGPVFMIAAAIAVVTVICIFAGKEGPLRMTVQMEKPEKEDSTA